MSFNGYTVHCRVNGGGFASLSGPDVHRMAFGGELVLFSHSTDLVDARLEIPVLFDFAEEQNLDFVFIVPPRRPPVVAFRVDPPIRSFLCRGTNAIRAIVSTFLVNGMPSVFAHKCYSEGLASGNLFRLAALQSPADMVSMEPVKGGRPADWVMAHRGDLGVLRNCLGCVASLTGAAVNKAQMLVGLDEAVSQPAKSLLRKFGVRGYYASCPGGGPYPIRNELIQLSTSPLVCFQDSDDLSCIYRDRILADGFVDGTIGMVGSHEVRIDDIRQKILPVRYPLDVSRALLLGPFQALLHPTSMIRVDKFLAAGGFSTHAKMSMDTQFLFRSYFYFAAVNIDAFLYVRRIHRASLTQSQATGMRSLPRLRVSRDWRRDFGRILDGVTNPSDCSLAPTRSEEASMGLREIE